MRPAHDAASADGRAYDDEAALARFAEAVDVVTFEFENVPTASVEFLSARSRCGPGARALALTQDRLVEKKFLRDLGLETAPFVGGRGFRRAGARGRRTRPPLDPQDAPLRLRRQGPGDDPRGLERAAVHRTLGGGADDPRRLRHFRARSLGHRGAQPRGRYRAYDFCENEHERHILARTRVPARVGAETARGAKRSPRAYSRRSTTSASASRCSWRERHGRERLVVNEIAPRVHNSGHWTIDGAQTSQFEQHVRAIAGWPLGSPTRRGGIEMHNLIGEDAEEWRDILAQPDLSLHLYGKLETRARPQDGACDARLSRARRTSRKRSGHVLTVSPRRLFIPAPAPGGRASPRDPDAAG